jgi:hypothetical protein
MGQPELRIGEDRSADFSRRMNLAERSDGANFAEQQVQNFGFAF